jgi:hypothetical protein
VKYAFPKVNGAPKSQVKVNVLNESDKVKILEVLRDSLSLAEVGRCYQKIKSSISSSGLNSAS